MALNLDVWGVFLMATSAALMFLVLRWLAGLLIGTPLEPVGHAILNVYP